MQSRVKTLTLWFLSFHTVLFSIFTVLSDENWIENDTSRSRKKWNSSEILVSPTLAVQGAKVCLKVDRRCVRPISFHLIYAALPPSPRNYFSPLAPFYRLAFGTFRRLRIRGPN